MWQDDNVLIKVTRRAKQQKTTRKNKGKTRVRNPSKSTLKDVGYYAPKKRKRKPRIKPEEYAGPIKYDYGSEFSPDGHNHKRIRTRRRGSK